MSSIKKALWKRGFSLVELMIVVAIIGVLATIGVPTFRSMVQKAKKSEAKVNLGGIFTAEAAFNAEYSVYGSNLQGIGFDGGSTANRIYALGFTTAACAAQYTTAATVMPSNLAQRNALNSVFPSFYNGTNITSAIAATNSPTANCAVGTVAADGTTFVAGASGLISPKAATTEPDVWTIDQNRTLANTVDGVK